MKKRRRRRRMMIKKKKRMRMIKMIKARINRVSGKGTGSKWESAR